MKQYKFRLAAGLLAAVIVCGGLTGSVQAAEKQYTAEDVYTAAEKAVQWKKLQSEPQSETLINNSFLDLAGTTAGDWYPIALNRLGVEDDYQAYLYALQEDTARKYSEQGGLSTAKATEWHRISLAVLACGGNPEQVNGTDGTVINLIADGTYNRGNTASLGKQGLNGWVWALLALDSSNYTVPENSFNTRADIISEILGNQLENGGFSISDGAAEVDITAMAVTALSTYYSDGTVYPLNDTGGKITVRQAVDKGLEYISGAQTQTGGFTLNGVENAESAAQVIVALCSMGIDPQTDSRFIKNNHSALTALFRFQNADGGFCHTSAGESESMAGEQALFAMAAVWRLEQGLPKLYDFTEDSVQITPQSDTDLSRQIEQLLSACEQRPSTQYMAKLKQFLSLAEGGKAYVDDLLYERMKIAIQQLQAIENTISELNTLIETELYPKENISVNQKGRVEDMIHTYNGLSGYDQGKISDYEAVTYAKTKIDTDIRSIAITTGLAAAVTVIALFLLRSLRKSGKKNQFPPEEPEDIQGDEL